MYRFIITVEKTRLFLKITIINKYQKSRTVFRDLDRQKLISTENKHHN